MDAGLAEKIKTFLADPGAAEKITAVAQTLGPSSSSERERVPAASGIEPMPTVKNDRSAQLISALRPLIREEKRSKLDSLERAMTMATLFSGIRKR